MSTDSNEDSNKDGPIGTFYDIIPKTNGNGAEKNIEENSKVKTEITDGHSQATFDHEAGAFIITVTTYNFWFPDGSEPDAIYLVDPEHRILDTPREASFGFLWDAR